MIFDPLINTIKKSAPLLAGILATPAASFAASLVASIFNGDPNSPDDLLKRVIEDPEAQFKLKQLELTNQATLLELERLYNQDRENARARELALAQLGQKDWILKLLAIINTCGFLAIIFALFLSSANINPSEAGLLNGLIGFIGGVYMTIHGYYFGNSHSKNLPK